MAGATPLQKGWRALGLHHWEPGMQGRAQRCTHRVRRVQPPAVQTLPNDGGGGHGGCGEQRGAVGTGRMLWVMLWVVAGDSSVCVQKATFYGAWKTPRMLKTDN